MRLPQEEEEEESHSIEAQHSCHNPSLGPDMDPRTNARACLLTQTKMMSPCTTWAPSPGPVLSPEKIRWSGSTLLHDQASACKLPQDVSQKWRYLCRDQGQE